MVDGRAQVELMGTSVSPWEKVDALDYHDEILRQQETHREKVRVMMQKVGPPRQYFAQLALSSIEVFSEITHMGSGTNGFKLSWVPRLSIPYRLKTCTLGRP
jgi:hypothetical protein